MDIKINFDAAGKAIPPTLVLMSRGGIKLGDLPSYEIKFRNSMTNVSELSFNVNKADCGDYIKGGKTRHTWDSIKDFKLAWVKDWNRLYEIYIDINDSNGLKKKIEAKPLGEAELSQIRLYDIEINTEEDIEREDYVNSILFNEDNHKASILHRVLDKAPHYRIGHVDSSIASIQRSFSFNNMSLVDALKEISEEIDCLVMYDCYLDSDYKIIREINVYDLQSYCLDCKKRGNFVDVCGECGSSNILTGYGEDTTIFISGDNLADDITFTTDVGSVKNMFKMEAGDDLMTATIANCNPNGTLYIFNISEDDMEDMSDLLVEKINEYNQDYDYYYNEYEFPLDENIINEYNSLIDKYSTESNQYTKLSIPVVGYKNLMTYMYEQIDFRLYLESGLMPTVAQQSTNAADQIDKLSIFSYTPVSVQDLSKCSVTTVTNSVLSMAAVIIDTRYKITVSDVSFSNEVWSGKFTATNLSDPEDTSTSDIILISINDDYEDFLKQKLDKSLSKSSSSITGIVDIFSLNDAEFENELKKYSLTALNRFHNACQACLNVLIEQGVMNEEDTLLNGITVYESLYVPYFNKLSIIASEIQVRDSELAVVSGSYNSSGDIVKRGVKIILDEERNKIQEILDFEKYLGEDLWIEFLSYRREDAYSNKNYISDGLSNSELTKNALEFIEIAKNEIFKASTLQHSISATMKNLLVMEEFKKILASFELGNWLRIDIDGKLYKLRLVDYEIDFDNLESLDVQFSDVRIANSSKIDVNKVIEGMKTISSSYDSIKRQAGQGEKSNSWLESWVDDGLSLTQMKIIDSADNQNMEITDSGILLREYIPETGEYGPRQIKIINNGLYFTTDNWLTSRAGIGKFYYYDPVSKEWKEAEGVIADTLVGNLILSKKVGVYNSDNSVSLDNDGFTLTSDYSSDRENRNVFLIQKRLVDSNGEEYYDKQMYLDDDGNLILNGTIGVFTDSGTTNLTDLSNDVRIEMTNALERTNASLREELKNTSTSINDKYDANIEEIHRMFNDYKADVGQYMKFGDNGLTLGASSSPYKTVIDNKGLYFRQEDAIISYIANSQLYIPSAVIESTLKLGNFFFSPREDGSFSLTWQT